MDYLLKYDVVHEIPETLRLLKFKDGNKNKSSKLILPPQAGHSSKIVDLTPDNSMVKCALENSDGAVYVIDYLTCNTKRMREGIVELLEQIDTCVGLIDNDIDLIALCQAGWSGLAYTCLNPQNIKTYTGAGAPFDFHACDSALSQSRMFDLRTYESVVSMQGGMIKGEWMLNNWIMLNPTKHYPKFPQIMSHRLFGGWKDAGRFDEWYYKDTSNIAGGWYLWAIENIFLNTHLFNNEVYIEGKHVDLNNLKKIERVNLIAGADDDICPPDMVYALNKYVDAYLYLIANAGHIGVFMKGSGLRDIWSYIFADMIGDGHWIGADQWKGSGRCALMAA